MHEIGSQRGEGAYLLENTLSYTVSENEGKHSYILWGLITCLLCYSSSTFTTVSSWKQAPLPPSFSAVYMSQMGEVGMADGTKCTQTRIVASSSIRMIILAAHFIFSHSTKTVVIHTSSYPCLCAFCTTIPTYTFIIWNDFYICFCCLFVLLSKSMKLLPVNRWVITCNVEGHGYYTYNSASVEQG